MAGEVGNVRDALVQIVLRLRDDVLKEKDGAHNPSMSADSLYPGNASISVSSVLPSVPPVAPLGYDQRHESGSGIGMLSSSSFYRYGALSVSGCMRNFLLCYTNSLFNCRDFFIFRHHYLFHEY